MTLTRPTRRAVLGMSGALASIAAFGSLAGLAQGAVPLMREIPSSGERIPAVGLGSWITLNVGKDPVLLAECAKVMEAFFRAGGRMIDSSPMYGSSQPVIGHGLRELGRAGAVFAADKVWTGSEAEGPAQIAASRGHWGVDRFDLMQVHNLVEWRAHLDTLDRMKAEGQLRYSGITTSHGRRHAEFEQAMRERAFDFVQLTYNPVDREAERRLLPLARERGMAVIVNRPFRRGSLTRRLSGQPLPGWAGEIGARTWAQAILKFIVSHPAVTVAIPATSIPAHAAENVAAASEPLPDAALRERIAADVRQLA